MSISALVSEAGRLIDVFSQMESDINSAVNDAIAALGSPGITYYVDAVAGSDSNAGTSEEAPFLTVHKALGQIDLMDGRLCFIKLAKGSGTAPVYTLSDSYYLRGCTIDIDWYTPSGRTTTPVLVQGAGLDANDGMRGFYLRNSVVSIDHVTVRTAAAIEDGAVFSALAHNLSQTAGGLHCGNCTVELYAADLVSSHSASMVCGLVACDVTRPSAGNAVVLDLGFGGTGNACGALCVTNCTIPEGETWKDDLVDGVTVQSSGVINCLSNIDIYAVG